MQTYRLETEHIALTAFLDNSKVSIQANFIDTPLTTQSLKNLIPLLEQHLPTIFQNKCYNDGNLSFRDEAKATEIGHLFEHVLMEYLCIEHECCSTAPIHIKGLTTWDWYNNPVGSFTIELTSEHFSMNTFVRSINQTITFMDQILTATDNIPSDFLALTLPEEITPAIAVIT